jgi:glucosamine-6-phosphate deaminase
MNIVVSSSCNDLGKAAADLGLQSIRQAISLKGEATVILATGTSQYTMLEALTGDHGVPWNKVRVFHLDEYIGIPADHPASFRKYLQERFVEKVGILADFIAVRGDAEAGAEAECARLASLIEAHPVDVAFVGIGENGHLAFNDPPADFDTEAPYIVAQLDEGCRMQQVGEGWFPSLDQVPARAISMSIRQIMKSKRIIVAVPDIRKARAVKCSVEGRISPSCPASILRTHADCHLFLDRDSASLLSDPDLVLRGGL